MDREGSHFIRTGELVGVSLSELLVDCDHEVCYGTILELCYWSYYGLSYFVSHIDLLLCLSISTLSRNSAICV